MGRHRQLAGLIIVHGSNKAFLMDVSIACSATMINSMFLGCRLELLCGAGSADMPELFLKSSAVLAQGGEAYPGDPGSA